MKNIYDFFIFNSDLELKREKYVIFCSEIFYEIKRGEGNEEKD